MKPEWVLTKRYLQRHKRQSIGAVVSIAVFCAAIVTALLLRDCILKTNEYNRKVENGHEAGGSYLADINKVTQQKQSLESQGCGIVYVGYPIASDNLNVQETAYMGYLDANAMHLKELRILKGHMPQNSNEVAIEENTYYKLDFHQSVGDTITLPIKTKNGVEQRKAVLCGILSDYVENWHYTADSVTMNNVSVGVPIPGIITNIPTDTQNVHVLYPEFKRYADVGGELNANSSNMPGRQDEEEEASNTAATVVTVIASLFFLVLIIYGIYGIVQITLKDREHYLGMLRCVGLTKKQANRMFLLQAGLLAAFTNLVGFVLGVIALFAIVHLASLFGQQIIFSLSVLPFLLSFLASSTTILLVFYYQTRKMLNQPILEYEKIYRPKRKKRRESVDHTVSGFWNQINHRAKHGKNRITTLLVGGCICCLVFGFFSAEFSAASQYYGAMQKNKGLDYELNVGGGVSSGNVMNTSFPRGMGVSVQNLKRLEQTPGIKVESACMEMMANAFILVKDGEKSTYLNQLKKNNRIQFGSTEADLKIPQKAGYQEDETIVDLNVEKIDTQTLKNLSKFVVDGKIDGQKFADGKEIAVVGTEFHVGDTITVTCPVFFTNSSQKTPNPKAQIHNFTARVGAVLSVNQDKLVNKDVFDSKKCVLFSAEAIAKVDPLAQYDTVYITKTTDDAKTQSAVRDVLHRVAAQSFHVSLTDVAEYSQKWETTVNQQKWPVCFAVVCLLTLILTAFVITTNMKLKTNLHSYTLLRALGMSNSQLSKRILSDNLRSCAAGIIWGIVISASLCTVVAVQWSYVPATHIYLSVLLPAALIGSAIIFAIATLACLPPIKWITQQNITSALNEIEF